MHELAICQALVTQVENLAAQHSAQSINSVTVQIGPLSGVEAELLLQAFPLACAGTVLEGAELLTEPCAVVVRCPDCDKAFSVAVNRLSCPVCHNWQTKLISGDELLLYRVDMERSEPVNNVRESREEIDNV